MTATRRALFGSATAAACLAASALPALAALAAPNPDAELIAAYNDMVEAFQRREVELSVPGLTAELKEAAFRKFDAYEDCFLDMPHRTPYGIALKMAWVFVSIEADLSLQDHVINGAPLPDDWLPHQFETRLINLIGDLKRMTRGAA